MADMSCLADGYVVPADFEQTGINLNELIVGPTGCGKSFSNAYSRLVHTTESSVVVPIAKGSLRKKFTRMFEDRGYEVANIDFAHPENSTTGYDPLAFIKSDEDVIHLASALAGLEQSQNSNADPYWVNGAISLIGAEIALVRLNQKLSGRKHTFADVVELHKSLKPDYKGELVKTNLDDMFDRAERAFPGCQACELWKTFANLPQRTASCLLSTVNSAYDKIFTRNIVELTRMENSIDFKSLGDRKTAFFITTSPMNKSLNNYINVMYSTLFKELFEHAEANEDGRLNIPVHIICDDFACGCRILDFEEYISIFRAAGISVTMLLQSESQLSAMYGEGAATTIINNCDTYVYMGGNDLQTCKNISIRVNKPIEKVLSMPLEQVYVFRRGSNPVISKRYQILEDPEFIALSRDENEGQSI